MEFLSTCRGRQPALRILRHGGTELGLGLLIPISETDSRFDLIPISETDSRDTFYTHWKTATDTLHLGLSTRASLT